MKMNKSIIRVAMCMTLILLPLTAFAQTPNPATDFSYRETATVIIITGYKKTGGSVAIPEKINNKPVTVIGRMAFYNKKLTAVTIPSSVTSIESSAFSGNQLTSVTIPSSVASIGRSAFKNNQLTAVTIGNRVTTIGDDAFSGNPLTSITIGANVKLGGTVTGDGVFTTVYNGGGRVAGTYTRSDPYTISWSHPVTGARAAPAAAAPLTLAEGLALAYQNIDHVMLGVSYDSLGLGTGSFLSGVMTCVNADGSVSVCARGYHFAYVYEYTADLRLIKTMRFADELGTLGAFTKDREGNYYFFYAMEVEGEDEAAHNTENMALVKYNSSGNKTNTYRLKAKPDNGFGIKRPFDAGACRLEVSGNMIAAYFGRAMFLMDDGINHQASYGFVLDRNTFARGGLIPFVSNSLNQFILPVDNGFVFADHGNADPTRAFTFAKFLNNAAARRVNAFGFKGGGVDSVSDVTYQYTFAQMGGVAQTSNSSGRDDGFIFTGTYENTTTAAAAVHNGSRNLFIVTINDAMTAVSAPVYITNYTNKETQNAANPKIAALGQGADRFLLLWEQWSAGANGYKSTHAAVIDRTGKILTPAKELPGTRLSRNDALRYNPSNGRVYWAIQDPADETRLAVYWYLP